MNPIEILITIISIAFATMLTRYAIFIIYKNRPIPRFMKELSDVLPYATMSLLVIYSLKDTHFLQVQEGLSTLISIIVIVGVHLYKRNTLLSIFLGTIVYMVLIQLQ